MSFVKWLLGKGMGVDWLTWLGHSWQAVAFTLIGALIVGLPGGMWGAFLTFLHREAGDVAKHGWKKSKKNRDTALDYVTPVLAIIITAIMHRYGLGWWWFAGFSVAYFGCGLFAYLGRDKDNA
jgi:hypothetical protein